MNDEIPPLPVEDTIQGSLNDEEGTVYVLFLRSRPSALTSDRRIMVQDTRGRILRVVLFDESRLEITLRSRDGELFNCRLTHAHDAYESSIARSLALVMLQNEQPEPIRDYMPSDYWRMLTLPKQ